MISDWRIWVGTSIIGFVSGLVAPDTNRTKVVLILVLLLWVLTIDIIKRNLK